MSRDIFPTMGKVATCRRQVAYLSRNAKHCSPCCGARHLSSATKRLAICRPWLLTHLASSAAGGADAAPLRLKLNIFYMGAFVLSVQTGAVHTGGFLFDMTANMAILNRIRVIFVIIFSCFLHIYGAFFVYFGWLMALSVYGIITL